LLPAVDFESIHPTFHTKLLRPYIPNDPELFPEREPPRPPPVVPDDQQYEVERITDHRIYRRQEQYLVHWRGYPDSDDQWVNARDIHRDLISEYRNSINV
jgi:hypothetical protein